MSFTSLTFSPVSSDVDCPPKDIYILELARAGEMHDKAAFKNSPEDPDIINVQSKWDFTIVDFEFDPDVDDKDWNGVTVSDYLVFFKKMPDGAVRETWKDERSNAYKFIMAFLGRKPEDGEEVDPEEFVGKRIKATVEPKASGWPKITGPTYHKVKKRRAAAVTEDDTDENPYKMAG